MSVEEGFVKVPCFHTMKIGRHCFDYEQTLVPEFSQGNEQE